MKCPVSALALGLVSPIAADEIEKADNADALHLGSCWIGGVAPGPDDIASYVGNISTQAHSRSPMEGDLSWGGIKVLDASRYGCRMGTINAVDQMLKLGAGGIVCEGTTTSNRSVVISTDVLLAADQTWTTNAAGGVSVSGTYRPEGSFFNLGDSTLTLQNGTFSFSGNNPASYEISGGTILLENATLNVRSGTRPTGLSPDPDCHVADDLTLVAGSGSSIVPFNRPNNTLNLHWDAHVDLRGGTLYASGFQGFFAGSATSTNSEIGGDITVTSQSTLALSNEITVAGVTTPTIHRVKSDLLGSSTLIIANESKDTAGHLITLAGDNSAFTGAIVLGGSDGLRLVRLENDTAGSASAVWQIGSANTLEVENASVSFGVLTGGGTLHGIGGGEVTVTAGGGNFTGAITCDTDTLFHYRKTGATSHSLLGNHAYNGDTLVEGGNLTLTKATLSDVSSVRLTTGATLRLNHSATDTVAALTIDGVEQAAGVWGAAGSDAEHESALLLGTGKLLVTGRDAFQSWMETFPGLSPSEKAATADPDGDGSDNAAEFAFAGNPVDAGVQGRWFHLSDPFRFVIALRDGTAFVESSGELVSSPVDGLVYRIQASRDLQEFTLIGVSEDAAALPPASLPSLPTGWTYRVFGASEAGEPALFFRAISSPDAE